MYSGVHGVILKKLEQNQSLVLFFNDKILNDYAVVIVDNLDLEKENTQIPQELILELQNSNKLNADNILKKKSFEILKFNEYDLVELIVEREEYAKCNIHKGEKGIVVIDYAVDNQILVDFLV